MLIYLVLAFKNNILLCKIGVKEKLGLNLPPWSSRATRVLMPASFDFTKWQERENNEANFLLDFL